MYTPFWKRAAAFLIDIPINFFCLFIALYITGTAGAVMFFSFPLILLSGDLAVFDKFFIITIILLLVAALLGILIPAFFESSRWQTTLGKQIMGLKVCDGNGKRLSFRHAFVRNIVKILSVVSILGVLAEFITKTKQPLHDIICNTLVINKSADISNLQTPAASKPEKIIMLFALIFFSFITTPVIFIPAAKIPVSLGVSKIVKPLAEKMDELQKEKNTSAPRTKPESEMFFSGRTCETEEQAREEIRKMVADLEKEMDALIEKNRGQTHITLATGVNYGKDNGITMYVSLYEDSYRIYIPNYGAVNIDAFNGKKSCYSVSLFKKTREDHKEGKKFCEFLKSKKPITAQNSCKGESPSIPEQARCRWLGLDNCEPAEKISQERKYIEAATEEEALDKVWEIMTTLKQALEKHVLQNGITEKEFFGEKETLDILNIESPGRNPRNIQVKNFSIYADLSRHFGGWWIRVDKHPNIGSLVWQADGTANCHGGGSGNKKWCEYLENKGFIINPGIYGVAVRSDQPVVQKRLKTVTPAAPPQAKKVAPMTEQEKLDKVSEIMSSLRNALDNYIAENGKTKNNLGYGQTLDALSAKFSERESTNIKVGDFRIFAMLSPNFGGWWIHADSNSGGGVLRWQGDGQRECRLEQKWCEYLKEKRLSAN